MKVKLENIYNAVESFKKLLNQELPVDVSFKFTQLFRDLNTEFNTLEASRLKLVKEFGDTQENGDVKVMDDTKKTKFLKKFNKLLQKEVKLNWTKVSIKDLGSQVTLTIPDLNSIHFLFTEFENTTEDVKTTSEVLIA